MNWKLSQATQLTTTQVEAASACSEPWLREWPNLGCRMYLLGHRDCCHHAAYEAVEQLQCIVCIHPPDLVDGKLLQ